MHYTPSPRDRHHPNYWDALYVDNAIPLDATAKACMVKDLQSWTRAYLLLPIKLLANITMALIMVMKRLLPFQFYHYRLMHRLAVWFLNTFATPEACYLIVRHFGIGSNIVNVLIDNGPDRSIPHATLYPRTVEELVDNAFLNHDIKLYNFVLDYHQAQHHHPQWLVQIQRRGLDFSSLRPIQVDVDITRRGRFQVLDMESALELFKICYSLFVTSDDFQRAVLSLQFDENYALYFSRITGDYRWNHLVKNRHPLAPNSPFAAARDLLHHGLMSEYLQRYLELTAEQALPLTAAVSDRPSPCHPSVPIPHSPTP
jgi:hypothetical protein